MGTGTGRWAKLRQVVIATTDHDGDLRSVRDAFGLGEGFADDELAELSLADATLAVSAERYLEFVSPTGEGALARWLAKIGGRGGYVLSVQHPDPDGVRARALEAGIGIPIDQKAFGHTILQLHPRDLGLVLEVDGIDDPAVWFWDDIDPGPEPGAGVDEVLGVEVPVADPESMVRLWVDLLELAAPESPDELDLGGAFVRFVAGGPSPAWTVHLRRSPGHTVSAPDLPGIAFELV